MTRAELYEMAKRLGIPGRSAMSKDQLVRAISKRWNDFGEPEAYVLSGLMPWEQEFYERFLKPDDEILIVGCGSGRDLIALLRAGYRVEGLEVAAQAATKARSMLAKAGLNARVTVGSIEDTSLVSKPFDVYIFSWFCYSYIPQAAARIDVLRKLRDHLLPGGRVLISYEPARTAPRLSCPPHGSRCGRPGALRCCCLSAGRTPDAA